MARRLFFPICLLIPAALFLLAGAKCPAAPQENGLESVPGADMTVYDLYLTLRETDPDQAMEYAELFLTRLDSTRFHPDIAAMEAELADYYERERFQFSKSIRWKERMLGHPEISTDEKTAAEIEYDLARLYYKKGQYHRTLAYTTEAHAKFIRQKDTLSILECNNLLGVVYYVCQDYEQADKYFQAYAKGVRQLNDSTNLVLALNNSAVLNILQDSAKTRKLIEESIRLCRRMNDTVRLCRLYFNIVADGINNGNYPKAYEYLRQTVPLLGNIETFGTYYHYLGILQFLEGRFPEAADNLNRAVSYYEQGEFDEMMLYCLDALQDIYAQTGKYELAWKALDRYRRLRYQSSREEVYLELFRTHNDIKLKTEEEALRERKNRMTLLLTSSSLILVIISLTVSMMLRRKSYLIRERESELRNEHEILEIRKMQQFQIDRMTEEVISRLQRTALETKDSVSRQRISQLCSDLRNSKDEGKWKEVAQYIPEFNSVFFQKLVHDFPELSVNERRLCALLNLNLTTKEISEITRQSPHSINIARTRLRSKLGITGSSTSIQEFLAKYNQ